MSITKNDAYSKIAPMMAAAGIDLAANRPLATEYANRIYRSGDGEDILTEIAEDMARRTCDEQRVDFGERAHAGRSRVEGIGMKNIIFTGTGGNWKARRATGEGEILASLATNGMGINTRLFEIVTDEHVTNANQETNAILMAHAPKMYHLIRAWLFSDPHGTHSDACRKIIEDIEKRRVE